LQENGVNRAAAFDEYFVEPQIMSGLNKKKRETGRRFGESLSIPLKRLLNAAGLDLVRYSGPIDAIPFPDVLPEDLETIHAVSEYTMTSAKRIQVLCEATRYISRARIPGDVVECGVWRGGSMMAVARTLLQEEDAERHLHLFDTFEGMTYPTEHDVSIDGKNALELMRSDPRSGDRESVWCVAPDDGVRSAMRGTKYPEDRIHLVKGRVEDTLPEHAPVRIALLRLDTDWYESTRHEMECLFPRLACGGVLLIDDYGHWKGARKAVDEYLRRMDHELMLHRIDYTGRVGVRVFF
jgi:hypothetical protein